MSSFTRRDRRVRNVFVVILVCLIGLCAPLTSSQTTQPHRDVLLNGLRVVLWTRSGDPNVVLKLRIHSGAAFDFAGKAGTMSLLGDILFPDATTHEYFTEELGGRLNVDTDYDSIDITMQGHAADFERMADILRTALITTQLTPVNVAKVRDARIKTVRGRKPTTADVANGAIAARLLGSFPYAQPVGGTVESLARIERPDLMLARERFLNPDNATLAIIGGVDERRAMRALRQLLGGWRKSEQIVPATFRQPDPPDTRTLILNSPDAQASEVRIATRGVARSDRDYATATLLAIIAQDRLLKLIPAAGGESPFVRHDAHFLPGMFVIGSGAGRGSAAKAMMALRSIMDSLGAASFSLGELEQAKSKAVAANNIMISKPDAMVDGWLDVDTYALAPTDEQMRASDAVTLSDLQRVATRLFRDAPIASVVVGNGPELKAELAPTQKIEVAGEVATPRAQPTPTPNSTPSSRPSSPILPRQKITVPFVKSPTPTPTPTPE